jgi:hypothetical protein
MIDSKVIALADGGLHAAHRALGACHPRKHVTSESII